MLDIKWIRENPNEFDQQIKKRGSEVTSKKILKLDEEKRQFTTLVQQLQHARKEKSKLLGKIKDKNSKEFEDAKQDAEHINEKLQELLKSSQDKDELTEMLQNLPNLPASDVPTGSSEEDNQVLRQVEGVKTIDSPKPHEELCGQANLLEFSQTAQISGSRFVTLQKELAKLERALINFAMDYSTSQYEFREVSPPYLVKNDAMYGAGQLPKFAEESFETTDGFRLIPTSEVPLVNLAAKKIIPEAELPLNYVAATPCFRKEAGSAGRDTKGIFRMHQFHKVELVSITTPENSDTAHNKILNIAEEILELLEIPYQVSLLCSGDMGFAASKTYDIEAWMPGQNRYREVSSCSNCRDFQARRAKARYRPEGTKDTSYLHTLNGTGLAVGRVIIAIMENYQNSDGSVTIPEKLVPYMGGVKSITG